MIGLRVLATCCGLVASVAAASADDSVESFYRGKHVTVYIGSAAGGGTDAYGRLIARFLGDHLPGNPAVVPANMPGANGMVVVNQLYNALPRDGTAIGTFDRNVILQAVWQNPGAKFQPEKLAWLGSANVDASTCVTWHTTGVTTLEQFMTRDLAIGSTAVYNVNVLDNLFGAHLHLINGYPGGNDVSLALERGEIEGRCNWSWSSVMGTRADWVRDKKINVIVQFAEKKHPDLPNVPLASELAKTDQQRQIMELFLSTQEMARPFAAPPGVPADRVKALQDAFDAAVHDARYGEEADKQLLENEPVGAARVTEIVRKMTAAPRDILDAFRDAAMKTNLPSKP